MLYDLNFLLINSLFYGLYVMRPLFLILPTHERFAVCAKITTNIVPPIINLTRGRKCAAVIVLAISYNDHSCSTASEISIMNRKDFLLTFANRK